MTDLTTELVKRLDPSAFVRRVAEQVCALVPAADAAFVALRDSDGGLVVVSASGLLKVAPGLRLPLHDTLSGACIRQRRPLLCRDLDQMAAPGTTRTWVSLERLRSLLVIPLVRDGVSFGVVGVAARRTVVFGDELLPAVGQLSDFLSTIISLNSELAELVQASLRADLPSDALPYDRLLATLVDPELAAREELRGEVDAVIRSGSLSVVFQPVARLADGVIEGLEALSRFEASTRTTLEWFRAAHRVDCGAELELHALRTALTAAVQLPAGYVTGLNLSPPVALDPRAHELLAAAPKPVVLELTEYEPAPERLARVLEPLRRDGVLLAVDDAGCGYAGFNEILRLRPDILKLDRELTAGIDHDPVRRALTAALVHFAQETGAVTVAEGIETEEQRLIVRDLGVDYGQGYWIGWPAPVDDLRALPVRRPAERPDATRSAAL